MSRAYLDIFRVLFFQIRANADANTLQSAEQYLRSTDDKRIFAEKRLRSLRRRVAYHKRGRKDTQHEGWRLKMYPQNRKQIEMDFDHCVSSIRSSLEHLAQLVNAIIPLNLPPRGLDKSVTLNRVITTIDASEALRKSPHLSGLSLFLRKEMKSDWFKDLHDLRIESFHDKSGQLPRTETEKLERQLLDLNFLLPEGTVTSAKSEGERDILFYLEGRVNDVERVLKTSFELLSTYLSDKFGNESLETSENRGGHS